MYENIDKEYKRVYDSFKATPPKLKDYLIPQLPDDQEVLLLINHAVQPYKSILALAYECGLRRSEILLLKIGDIEDLGDYIRLHVRNSKSEPRMVFLVRFKEILRDWIRKHPWRRDPEAYLFPSKTISPYVPLNPTTMYNYLGKLRKKLEIKKRIYLHLLRHKRATELYKELSEKEMMLYFGWTTRTMLDIYSHITQKDVEEKILKLYGIKSQPPTPRQVKEIEEAKALIDKLIQFALTSPELLRSLLLRAQQRDKA